MKNYKFNMIIIIFLMTIISISCKDKSTTPNSQNDLLKGNWTYPNGAELYYDGISTTAKGTKTPTNNIFGFIVGEDYWQDLKFVSADKWTVNQILRSIGGAKMYNATNITKIAENTIQIDITGFGKETLTRK